MTEKGVGSTTFTNYYVARESRCTTHAKHAKENERNEFDWWRATVVGYYRIETMGFLVSE